MGQLDLNMFGRFTVVQNGEAITSFRTQKVLALLALLAAEPENAHRREKLMTLLWPGMPESSARQNLRQVLYHLRQIIPVVSPRLDSDGGLESVPLVVANRHTMQLNPAANAAVDVAEFDDLLAQSQAHDHVDLLACVTCYETLSTAVALYEGAFLADFYLEDSNAFESWAESTRQIYRRKMLDALEILAAIALRRNAYAEARAYAERQIEIDDLRESAYRQQMEILALSGRRSEAAGVYESYRRLLAAEMGMAPAARTTELYEKILAGDLVLDHQPGSGVRGYDMKESIGAGAHGEIFRAVQTAIDREVAVKVLRRRFANAPDFIRRFEAEAQTVARLEHPHIVPLYDYWREPDGAYLVMRLLRGGSLADVLEGGPLDLPRTQLLLDQIASALYAAHGQKIIHRDIKPANILFDETGYAYLSDFGIAKNLLGERGLTLDEGILGTPDYISPEQLDNGPISPQTDIYSLGAVLYEALSGEKPFADRSLAELLQGHLSDAFPLVSETRSDIPPGVDRVIQRATAKRPGDRFANTLDMAGAFREAWGDSGRETFESQGWAGLASGAVKRPNPYKGLRPYQEADAGDFYGREALINALIERTAASRFLAVVGPSGSGKSSAVRAGLIPALRAGALPGSESWYVATMTPGTHPLEELELALWPIAVDPPPSLVEPMLRDSRGMLRTIRRILAHDEQAQLLLVIDQFEELFTLVDAERRGFFLDSLLEAVADPQSPLRVVVTLRADFYDRPLQYEPTAALFKAHTELVLPLTREELAQAILEPAKQAGVRFEEGVVTAVIADTSDQPGTLPLMQYALTELYEAQNNDLITRKEYAEIGGVAGALERRAEEIYTDLSAEEQDAARQLFLRLVTLGEGVEDTRRRVSLPELSALSLDAAGPVIALYGDARLLVFDRDPLTRESTVEVAHEALLREWGRLRGWLEESREDVRVQRRLEAAAIEWEEADRDSGYLLRGARLSQFEAWQGDTDIALTQSEQAYLEASLAARQQREAEEEARRERELETAQQLAESERQRAEEGEQAARGLRRRALVLAGALVAAALLAGAALFAWQQARENAALAARSALESQSLALASGAQASLADEDADQALMLALAANDIADPPALAQKVLYDAVRTPGTKRRILGGGGWRWAMDAYPDKGVVASGADDMAVTIWDVASGEELMVLAGEHTDSIGDVVFLPGGERLLSGAYDDLLVLWDLNSGTAIRRMQNPTGDVNILDVSPDGRMAVAGTEGGVATLWDLSSGELAGELAGHNPDLQVLPVTFSADGRLIATGSEDGSAIIWDSASREPLQELQVLDDVLFALAFSPDGALLAAGGKGNAVYLYDVQTGELAGTLDGLPDWLFDLDFNGDGSQLLVASRDGAVMLWDVAARQLLQSFTGTDGRTLSVSFIDDETAVSSASSGDLRVWNLADSRLLGQIGAGDFLVSTAYSADGRLAALGLNEAIRLVDLDTGASVGELSIPGAADPVLASGDVTALAFDPSGERLLSGTGSGALVLWDAAGGAEIRRFEGHESRIHELVFSPDGRSFLSAADDRQLIKWDAQTGEKLFSYQNPTDSVNAVAYSPDGRSFAAGMGTFRFASGPVDPDEVDNSIHVWDSASGAETGQLAGHEGPVMAVAFSPDGRQLLSGSIDTTLRLWDVAAGKVLQRLDGHTSGVLSLDYDGDGGYIASGAEDGTVIVWEAETGDLLRQIDGHEGVVHTVAFTPEGAVRSAAEDGDVKLWDPALDREALLAWAQNNRYVPNFSCEQRTRFGLEAGSACALDGGE